YKKMMTYYSNVLVVSDTEFNYSCLKENHRYNEIFISTCKGNAPFALMNIISSKRTMIVEDTFKEGFLVEDSRFKGQTEINSSLFENECYFAKDTFNKTTFGGI